MLAIPTFLIFVSLSVAAIPLSPPAIGQTPDISRIPSLIPVPAGLPDLHKALPAELLKSLTRPKILERFIMGADYASSSGPFLGKSSHKRQDPLSGTLGSTTLRANDLKGELPPNLSPGSTPT